MSIRLARGIALVGASVLWAACAKNEAKTDSAAAADSAAKAAAAAPAPAPAPPALNDANIAALLDEVNAADSAAGSLASTKGTNAQVKEFGRTMMRDHHHGIDETGMVGRQYHAGFKAQPLQRARVESIGAKEAQQSHVQPETTADAEAPETSAQSPGQQRTRRQCHD